MGRKKRDAEYIYSNTVWFTEETERLLDAAKEAEPLATTASVLREAVKVGLQEMVRRKASNDTNR